MDTTERTWPLIAVLLLFFTGAGASLPVLPAAVRAAGAGPTSLGVALGLFAFAALAGRLVAGRLTDRRGRVLTLRIGLAGTVLAGAVFAAGGSVATIGTARVLHGLADALLYTAASAYVLDRTPADRRAQALSLLGAGIWAGYALGPLVGAFLDLRRVGLLIAVGALLGLVLTKGLVESTVDGPRATGMRALLPRGVALPGLALGLGNLGYAALVGFLVVHLDDGGGNGALALTCFSVAVLSGRLLVVPAAARLGILRTLPYALLAMAAGLVVIAGTRSTLVAGAAAALVGLGYCLPFPALAMLVADRVPASQRGAAIGALTAFYDVFVGVGSIGAGLVAARSGTPAVFLLAAVGVVGAAAVNVALGRQHRLERVLADAAPDV
ncbi:MAG: MFS transporter [Frankiales bacterium]|nr:MFS transporter [Frankiales bacterium]